MTELYGYEVSEPIPATFPRRLVARLIDGIIVLAMMFFLVIPVTLLFLPALWPFIKGGEMPLWWGPLGGCLCLALAVVSSELFLLWRRNGQTFGKGLVGIAVVSVDGHELTRASALTRVVVLWSPLFAGFALPPFLLIYWVSIAMVALDFPRHRALHDWAGQSRVVMAPRRGVRAEDFGLLFPVVSLKKDLL